MASKNIDFIHVCHGDRVQIIFSFVLVIVAYEKNILSNEGILIEVRDFLTLTMFLGVKLVSTNN